MTSSGVRQARRARLRRSSLVLASFATILISCPAPVLAYLKFGTVVNGRSVDLKWAKTPARYFVTDRDVSGVTSTQLQAALARAFATWQDVPTSTIGFEFVGFTSATPDDEDGQSTIGFVDRFDLDRVLATTSFLIDVTTGELLEADIAFNTAFEWSVADAGEAGRYDLQSIALHETGHFSGLGHSALGETETLAGGGRRVIASEAVMFPIAFAAGSVAGRSLRADDVAGISDLYPDNGFGAAHGSVSGLVTHNGLGVLGAHVVAFDPSTGALVGGLSLDDSGRFVIGGLSPGPYVIRVEPLDDVDPDSFFEGTVSVDLDFRATFLDRLVIVPRGGTSGSVDAAVASK